MPLLLGIPVATLHTLIHKLKKNTTTKNTDNTPAKDIATLIEENRRLHKELAIAKTVRYATREIAKQSIFQYLELLISLQN